MTGSKDMLQNIASWLTTRLHQHADSKIAVTAHIRPDGDAIGSAVGLFHLLRDQNIAADLLDLGPIPQRYAFLTEGLQILPSAKLHPEEYDMLIVLDTGAIDRAPEFVTKWQNDISVVNIDHHPTNTAFGNENCIIANASAVSEIMVDLAQIMQWPISKRAATALWVGITTDSGRFAYSCTTPNTLRASACLLESNIDTADLDQKVFQTLPLPALKLQARAIDRMQLQETNKLAVIGLSNQDFCDCEAKKEHAEEIINIPRRLDTVEVAVLCTEMADTPPDAPQTKVSLRTQPPFDAGLFCRALGGGGHARAAGCECALPLEKTIESITRKIRDAWFSS